MPVTIQGKQYNSVQFVFDTFPLQEKNPNVDYSHLKDAKGRYSIDISKQLKSIKVLNEKKDNEPNIFSEDFIWTFEKVVDAREIQLLGHPHLQPNNQTNFNYKFRGTLLIENIDITVAELHITNHLYNFRNDCVEIGFRITSNTRALWQKLKAVKLCELDLGSFTWTLPNLQDNWENHFPYQQGQQKFYFGLKNFGKRFKDGGVHITEFMPDVYVYPIICEILKKVGYTFKSNFLKSDFGRRLAVHLLDGNLFKRADLLADRSVYATTNSSEPLPNDAAGSISDFEVALIKFQDDFISPNSDISGLYNPLTGFFNSPFGGEYCVEVCLVISFDNNAQQPGFDITSTGGNTNVSFNFGQSGEYTEDYTIDLQEVHAAGGQKKFSFTVDNVVIEPYQDYRLAAFSNNMPYIGSVEPTSTIKIIAKKVGAIVAEGETRQIADLINCEYNAFDFIKGVNHIINGKLRVDAIRNHIYWEPAHGYDIYNCTDEQTETMEGTYTTKRVELLEALDNCGAVRRDVDTNKFDKTKQFKICYKEDSDDSLVNALQERNGYQLHSNNVKLRLVGKNGESCNPFFAPTETIYDATASDTNFQDLDGDGTEEFIFGFPQIPALWKGDFNLGNSGVYAYESQPTKDLGFCPRIFIVKGWTEETQLKYPATSAVMHVYYNQFNSLLVSPFYPKLVTLNKDNPDDANLVYGHPETNDNLTNKFYKRFLLEKLQTMIIKFAGYFDLADYIKIRENRNNLFQLNIGKYNTLWDIDWKLMEFKFPMECDKVSTVSLMTQEFKRTVCYQEQFNPIYLVDCTDFTNTLGAFVEQDGTQINFGGTSSLSSAVIEVSPDGNSWFPNPTTTPNNCQTFAPLGSEGQIRISYNSNTGQYLIRFRDDGATSIDASINTWVANCIGFIVMRYVYNGVQYEICLDHYDGFGTVSNQFSFDYIPNGNGSYFSDKTDNFLSNFANITPPVSNTFIEITNFELMCCTPVKSFLRFNYLNCPEVVYCLEYLSSSKWVLKDSDGNILQEG